MPAELITRQLDLARPPAIDDVAEAIRQQHALRTWQTWQESFRGFARFVRASSPTEAAAVLIAHGPGPANRLALAYRADMVQRDLSTATINVRLWALRKAVQMARTLGLVEWTLESPGIKLEAYRDVEGPGVDWVKAALRLLSDGGEKPLAVRNLLIVRLIFDFGLRRGSVASLDVADVDLAGGKLWVRLKGSQRDPRAKRIPEATGMALATWLDVRGRLLANTRVPGICEHAAAPLIIALRGRRFGGRLTGRSIHCIIQKLAQRIGSQPVWPHAIRHTSISYVAEKTGDAYITNAFADHLHMSTTLRYIDGKDRRAFEGANITSEVE